jgi:nitrous oxidase accessory protein NosD
VASARTIVVKPHHSIQAAINKARRGDTVVVKRGTYREALVIKTDRVTLRGEPGAVLTLPAKVPDTPCGRVEGGATGICVVGNVTPNGGVLPTVNKTVNGVTIVGITVRGFSATGILGFGTKNLTVSHTRLLNDGGYGVFSNTSSGTSYLSNVASGNHEAGLYIGDSPQARASVIGNRSVNNAQGMLARSASFGTVRGNVFTGNCVGIILFAGSPGPATHWKVTDNTVRKNNRACANPGDNSPPLSGIGIWLLGAGNTSVTNNSVTGNSQGSNPSPRSGGIIVGNPPGAAAPTNDTVKDNHLLGNSPVDLFWNMTGTVKFTNNHCKTSSPTGLCK